MRRRHLLTLLQSPHLSILAAFGCTSIVNYGFGLVAGWLLLPGDFGLLAFAQTLLLIAGLILTSGFARALTAELARPDGGDHAAQTRGAVAANLALSVVLGLLVVLLYALGPLRGGLESNANITLIAVTLPLIAYNAIAVAAAIGVKRFRTAALITVVEVIAKATVGVALVLTGHGVTGAIAGFFVGAVAAAVPGTLALRHLLLGRPLRAFEPPSLGAAGSMFGAILGQALLLNLDIVAVKLSSGGNRAVVGQYQASSILANTPYYLVAALLSILFTRLVPLRSLAATRATVGGALRLALVLVAPLELILAAEPGAALWVFFPHAYGGGASLLRLLALGNYLIIPVIILSTAFQATGRASVPARILLLTTAAEAVAQVLVTPIWRADGAAILFLIATLSALCAEARTYCHALDKPVAWRALRWLGTYVVAVLTGTTIGAIALIASGNVALAVTVGILMYLVFALLLNLLRLPTHAFPPLWAGRRGWQRGG